MSKYRILVLVNQFLLPPEGITLSEVNQDDSPWMTEFDVITNLKEMGHEVLPLGVYSDLKIIRESIEEFKPHIIFNLLEEFDGEAIFDQNVVSYLELLRTPYTGCHPRGLILARDKALAKKILTYHRISTPKFCVFPKNKKKKRPKALSFPLIVKCLNEEASLGISRASVVHNDEKLQERIQYIHQKLEVDAIAEEFIAGREYFVGIIGNSRLQALPIWELRFEQVKDPEKEFYSSRAKWNTTYRVRKGIRTAKADLTPELERKIIDLCKKSYIALDLKGYARMDLRVDKNNNIYMIEANPNPDISQVEDFAVSAKEFGLSYQELLSKIITLGLSS